MPNFWITRVLPYYLPISIVYSPVQLAYFEYIQLSLTVFIRQYVINVIYMHWTDLPRKSKPTSRRCFLNTRNCHNWHYVINTLIFKGKVNFLQEEGLYNVSCRRISHEQSGLNLLHVLCYMDKHELIFQEKVNFLLEGGLYNAASREIFCEQSSLKFWTSCIFSFIRAKQQQCFLQKDGLHALLK